jgi:hypothetical protein
MMETLNITWNCGKGRMRILLDKFFPSTKKDLKKLLSISSLDWEHETELKEKLKTYFEEKQSEHESAKKENAKKHFEFRQREADTKEMVTTKKCPNGVPLSEDELKKEKERLAFYKATAKDYLLRYKQHEKEEKQFSEYLKLL